MREGEKTHELSMLSFYFHPLRLRRAGWAAARRFNRCMRQAKIQELHLHWKSRLLADLDYRLWFFVRWVAAATP